MESVSTRKESSQINQSSEKLGEYQSTTSKGDGDNANPLRVRSRSVREPPVKSVKVPASTNQPRPPSEEVRVVNRESTRTLGCWQDQKDAVKSVVAAPAALVLPPVVKETSVTNVSQVSVVPSSVNIHTSASLGTHASVSTHANTNSSMSANSSPTKGDHSRPRRRSKDREGDKFSTKKAFRDSSKSPLPVRKEKEKSPPPKRERKDKSPPKRCSPVRTRHHMRRSSPKKLSPRKVSPRKVSPAPPPKPATPVPPPKPSTPANCGDAAHTKGQCTECNPEGDMCAPITIADFYRLSRSKEVDDNTRHFAKQLLSILKCPPSCIGRDMWSDFDYCPLIWNPKPTKTCHCGEDRQTCRCITSVLTVCRDGDGVSLDEFNFHYPNIESVNGEVTVWPFGNRCVPSPLHICEEAQFTIYAVKRHLHKNLCCDKCKSADTCTHRTVKADEEEINYDYIIQWAYDAIKRGDEMKNGVKEMICCTLRTLKDKEDCLSDDMYKKYCHVYEKLALTCKTYPHPDLKPRKGRGRSPSRERSRSISSSRSRSTSRSCSESPRKRSPEKKEVSARERSQSSSRSPSREKEDTHRRREKEESHQRRDSSPASSPCPTPQDKQCHECNYPREKCKCCEKCHLLKCKCKKPSPVKSKPSPKRLASPKRTASPKRESGEKICGECRQPRRKCKCCCKCHKAKCECALPNYKESPFTVYIAKGKWVCESVPCKTDCRQNAQGVRYRIVLNEMNLEHIDGDQVCGGWKWLNGRYTSFYFKMCPQKLDFFPCNMAKESDCGC
jgi:hypothetical protein